MIFLFWVLLSFNLTKEKKKGRGRMWKKEEVRGYRGRAGERGDVGWGGLLYPHGFALLALALSLSLSPSLPLYLPPLSHSLAVSLPPSPSLSPPLSLSCVSCAGRAAGCCSSVLRLISLSRLQRCCYLMTDSLTHNRWAGDTTAFSLKKKKRKEKRKINLNKQNRKRPLFPGLDQITLSHLRSDSL